MHCRATLHKLNVGKEHVGKLTETCCGTPKVHAALEQTRTIDEDHHNVVHKDPLPGCIQTLPEEEGNVDKQSGA